MKVKLENWNEFQSNLKYEICFFAYKLTQIIGRFGQTITNEQNTQQKTHSKTKSKNP